MPPFGTDVACIWGIFFYAKNILKQVKDKIKYAFKITETNKQKNIYFVIALKYKSE